MYYIGEVSDLDGRRLLIELWHDVGFACKSDAKKELKKIKKVSFNKKYCPLQIIDEKKYDVAKSQGWE